MKSYIPFVKIEKNKDQYQFYFKDVPIHPDHLFPQLRELEPDMIYVQVYKYNKLYWDAHYPVHDVSQIESILWKALRFKI